MLNIQSSDQQMNTYESVGDFVKRQFKEHCGRILDINTLADWEDDLKGFSFFNIHRAFAEFRRDNKYPPKPFEIRKLIFDKLPKKIVKENVVEKCCIENCHHEFDQEMDGKNFCRQHADDRQLEKYPDHPQSDLIRMVRAFEIEAKNRGITSEEYFKKTNPKIWESITRDRGRQTERGGEAKKVFE